jgi:hypothetical protein
MHDITELAWATINGSDTITIQLVEPDGRPARVRIGWPTHPTLIDPGVFPDTAAAMATLFARAHIVLAGLKAAGEL